MFAGKKKKYVVLQSLQPFSSAQVTQLVLPTGETVAMTEPYSFRNLSGEIIGDIDEGQLVLTDWIRGACPGALLQAQM